MDILDSKIQQILSPSASDNTWRDDLRRLENGDITLTRRSAGENSIKAIQRMLVFLGYSTASSGAFLIDGDFGRGTNRGVAQFQFEHDLTSNIHSDHLCYPCSFNNARSRITAIPDVQLDLGTLKKMVNVALDAIRLKTIPFGDFDSTLFHLNALQQRRLLNCREILDRYGEDVHHAVAKITESKGFTIKQEWILAIIKQETSGIARPRFEQHKLSKFYQKNTAGSFPELRIRSMSIGLGQIMGFNHDTVGASSAVEMLYSPISDQISYIARFLSRKKQIVVKSTPSMADFMAMARYYNGPKYAKHFYHERLQRWFNEFQQLLHSG